MILMYHNVVPNDAPEGYKFQGITLNQKDFAKQIKWLNKHYQIISFQDYIEKKQKGTLNPKKHMAITFDDGTKVTYDNAEPILAQYKVPATIFVTTCQLDNGPLIWGAYYNALCYEKGYEKVSHDGIDYPLDTDENRRLSKVELEKLAISSGQPVEFTLAFSKSYPLSNDILLYYQGMTSSQLEQAGKSEWIEIGAHSVNHPFLAALSAEAQHHELKQSKEQLESKIGKKVKYFAYPSGDYNVETIKTLQALDYEASAAVVSKNLGNQWEFEIPRIGVFSPSIMKLRLKLIKASYLN